MKRTTLAMLCCAMLLSLAGCGDETDGSDAQRPADLVDQKFELTSIASDDGMEFTGPVTVGFPVDDRGKVAVGWQASCNRAGADVEITSAQLILQSKVASTAMGCPAPLLEEDEWLARFFESNPSWELDDGSLTLRTSEATIQLESRSPGSSSSAAAAERSASVAPELEGFARHLASRGFEVVPVADDDLRVSASSAVGAEIRFEGESAGYVYAFDSAKDRNKIGLLADADVTTVIPCGRFALAPLTGAQGAPAGVRLYRATTGTQLDCNRMLME